MLAVEDTNVRPDGSTSFTDTPVAVLRFDALLTVTVN